jgi:hypothetical protein
VHWDYLAARVALRNGGIIALKRTHTEATRPRLFLESEKTLATLASDSRAPPLPLRTGQEGCAQEEGAQEGRPQEGAQEGYAHFGERTFRHISNIFAKRIEMPSMF